MPQRSKPHYSWNALLVAYALASTVFGLLAVLAVVQGRGWGWVASYIVLAVLCAVWLGVVVHRQYSRIRTPGRDQGTPLADAGEQESPAGTHDRQQRS